MNEGYEQVLECNSCGLTHLQVTFNKKGMKFTCAKCGNSMTRDQMLIDTTYGHPDYYGLIAKMAHIHGIKNRDYGGGNPIGNFLNVERLGVDPFDGVLVRMSDKWSRIESLHKSGKAHVKDESIEDTLIDLANYALLAMVVKNNKGEKQDGCHEQAIQGCSSGKERCGDCQH